VVEHPRKEIVMKNVFVVLRLLFLLASVLFAGVSLFPSTSRASFCPKTCGPQGPIACGGASCRRPE
jgi:hypothetical protein